MKTRVSVDELERLILARLRATPAGEGAARVEVRVLDEPNIGSNWGIARIEPGTANLHACCGVLARLVPALQAEFDLAQGKAG